MNELQIPVTTKLSVEIHQQVMSMAHELGHVIKLSGRVNMSHTVAHLVEIGLEALAVKADTAAAEKERQEAA